jgi:S-adenosylmethionine synthetase
MKRYSSVQVAFEGHPDRVCDILCDALLDEYLKEDKNSSIDIGAMLMKNRVILAGEVSSSAKFNVDEVVRKTLKSIGYTGESFGLDAYKVDIETCFKKQSQDIARGVNADERQDQGAGDIATMYGFAMNYSQNYMPTSLEIAWSIANRIREVFISGVIEGIGPDGKVQVIMEYDDLKATKIEAIIIAIQHLPEVDSEWLRMEIMENVVNVVCCGYTCENTKILVNTAGKFLLGGPMAELGMSGTKMEMYTYGGFANFGGNTFSGKDPYKIDRTGSLMARKVARYIVEQGMAEKCEIMASYAIGLVQPVILDVDTFETSNLDESEILKMIKEEFSFSTADIVENLNLLKPIYQDLSRNGHFGRTGLKWEENGIMSS